MAQVMMDTQMPAFPGTSLRPLERTPASALQAGLPIIIGEAESAGVLVASGLPYVKFLDGRAMYAGKEVVRLDKVKKTTDGRIRNGEKVYITAGSFVLRGSGMSKYLKWKRERDEKSQFIVLCEGEFLTFAANFELQSVKWPSCYVGKCFSPPFSDSTLNDKKVYFGHAALGSKNKKWLVSTTLKAIAPTTHSDLSVFDQRLGATIQCPGCRQVLQIPRSTAVQCPVCRTMVAAAQTITVPVGVVPLPVMHTSTSATMSTARSGGDCVCPHCHASFNDAVQLVDHVQAHEVAFSTLPTTQALSSSYSCPVCRVSIEDPVELVTHVERVHDNHPSGTNNHFEQLERTPAGMDPLYGDSQASRQESGYHGRARQAPRFCTSCGSELNHGVCLRCIAYS